jgi:serine/threonine-protein kinase RsbW
MNSAASRLRLKITSNPANLADVRHAIETLSTDNGFDQKATDEIGLCVNEAMANVIRHAYDGATDKPMDVSAEVVDGELRIAIRDWGNGVNPHDLPPKPPNPLKPGGLGLVCLKQMMDEVRFTPQRDGGILLEMIRRKTK